MTNNDQSQKPVSVQDLKTILEDPNHPRHAAMVDLVNKAKDRAEQNNPDLSNTPTRSR